MFSMMESRSKRATLAAFVGVFLFLFFGAAECSSEEEPEGVKRESKVRTANYNQITKSQPAHTMTYSPTRATKNFWIDTWNDRSAVSYVYMRDANGEVYGYYVFAGLPVSYCTSLIPPVTEYKIEGDNSEQTGALGPAPSIDGTYNSGADCATKYGRDAVTGAYVEFNPGVSGYTLSNQPLAQYRDSQPLGDAKVGQVKKR